MSAQMNQTWWVTSISS